MGWRVIPKGPCRSLRLLYIAPHGLWVARVDKQRHSRQAGDGLLQKFYPLGDELHRQVCHPRRVAPWPRKAVDKFAANRIGHNHEYNRDCLCRILRREGSLPCYGHQHIDVQPSQFPREFYEALRPFIREAMLECNVFALCVPQVLETLYERTERYLFFLCTSRVPENTDPRNLSGLTLSEGAADAVESEATPSPIRTLLRVVIPISPLA